MNKAVKYTGKSEVISTVDSFHGRTIMTLAATGHEEYHEPFKAVMPEGFINVPYNDINAIKEAVTENTAAIIVEPIQGEGGVHVPGRAQAVVGEVVQQVAQTAGIGIGAGGLDQQRDGGVAHHLQQGGHALHAGGLVV